MYLQLLPQTVDPILTDILKQNDRYGENESTFQQDEAPRHYTLAVHQYLNRTFLGR